MLFSGKLPIAASYIRRNQIKAIYH